MNDIIRKKNTGEPGNGGQFGHTAHAEADASLTEKSAAETIIDTIGDRKFDLIYVAYDDQLDEENIQRYLAGDLDGIYDEYFDMTMDARSDTAMLEARQLTEDAGLDWDDLDYVEQEEIRLAIEEHDESDPVPQLVRNTHNQLVRVPLLTDVQQASSEWPTNLYHPSASPDNDEVFNQRVAFLTAQLEAKGINASSNEAQTALRELVDNGPWVWHEMVDLDVIWYGDITNVAVGVGDDGVIIPRDLSFTNPEIVLIDRANGSGHEVTLPSTVRTRLTEEAPAILDSPRGGGRGYGWDDVAGVHKPAFAAPIESKLAA